VADVSAPAVPPADGERYQSLYRRYRPQRFEEVKGQDQVTRPLRNAVRDDRVGHAYLFSGPRGTGKTSTARILAMALNCAHPVDGEPDGTCPSCTEIRRGSSLDVQELDAASNRKLDEMRELLSRVSLGTSGRWKVYIVDEVHQLTSDAASALLKTLEEPPGHVVFVLATTDPQKVLPTIRSRTQHFEFRLLGPDVLGGLLREVNERAALGIASEALDLVVRRGHGSARDALSVLDQVAAAGDMEDETDVVSGIVDGVADRDAGAVLTGMATAMSAGRDPRRLAADLLEHLRNGFLATQARSLVMLPDDATVEVEAQARRLGLAGVVRALEVVGQAAVDMRDAVDPRVTLEVALVRLAAPRADEGTGALLRRLEQLEAQVEALTSAAGATAPGETSAVAAVTATPPAAYPPPRIVPPVAETPPAPDRPTPTTGAPAAPGPTGWAPRRAVATANPGVGAPPPQPGRSSRAAPGPSTEAPSPTGPSASRSALGAHRPGRESAPRATGVPDAPAPTAKATDAPAPTAGATDGPVPAPPAPATSAPDVHPPSPSAVQSPPRSAQAGPARAGSAQAGSPQAQPSPAGSAPPGFAEASSEPTADGAAPDADRPGAADSGSLPTRDELTKAWGDEVLPTLRTAVKAYVSSGRFVEVDGRSAVYALPDRGLLSRAQPLAGEIEAALTAHFGRSVPVRLVLDGESAPVAAAAPSPPPEEDDPSSYDFDSLQDAGPAVVSPEQRLLEAFPGAEEVTP
jgi:DNA polymerase-3 subunit gamma/tau